VQLIESRPVCRLTEYLENSDVAGCAAMAYLGRKDRFFTTTVGGPNKRKKPASPMVMRVSTLFLAEWTGLIAI